MRPFRSIDLDETFVIDEIDRYKQTIKAKPCDYITFIPSNPRQEGVDIVYYLSGGYKTIQVKGSKVYNKNGGIPTAWITLPEKYFTTGKCYNIDFFIFVFHVLVPGASKPMFAQEFLVIPYSDIDHNIKANAIIPSGEKYHFSFSINYSANMILQTRHKVILPSSNDFTFYWNNWRLL